MTSLLASSPQIGDLAPDFRLPNGNDSLASLQGAPVILAFAPDEWNPATAYESELFAKLALEFADGASFVDASTDEWHALDACGQVAEQWGVSGQRALFVLDEKGMVRWKWVQSGGEAVHPGEIIAALEAMRTPPAEATPFVTAHDKAPQAAGKVSRRTFIASTLAAAAVLSLPLGSEAEARGRSMLPRDEMQPKGAQKLSYDTEGTIPVTLRVNGQARKIQIEPRVALLDALREYMGLTGTKKGCDHGQCGACTVHVDGQRALSCLSLAVMNQGKEITTIEGLAQGEKLHPVQEAFIHHDAFQCGYCTPGQIMSAVALIKEGRYKTDAELREGMSGNLCRCAAYPNIIAAIKQAQTTA
jgi:xanthine dehydrogenase YagT iron-sulfur-binding subunit